MHRRFFSGRGILVPAGLALTIVSAWEISVRFDAMYRPIRMFFDMARGEGITLSAAMTYFDWGMFAVPAYLLACALTGLLALAAPGRRAVSAVLLALSAILAAAGLGRETGVFTGPWYLIQPALLLLLALGGAFGLLVRRSSKKRPVNTPAALPCDHPRLTDAPRLRSIRTGAEAQRADRNKR